MRAYIKAISYYLPENVLTNEKINDSFPEWAIDKIAQKTGIKERRIASKEEFSSDLAIKSGQKLFHEHSILPDAIDFILFCTQTPDYILPTTACIIQHELNIPRSAGALDFNLGCSGYIYGLSIAKGLIESRQAKNVLLLTAETYSKLLHPLDKSVITIFGDGASASLITLSDSEAGICDTIFGTDGSGALNLIVKTGGARFPKGNVDNNKEDYLSMNGAEIFNFTLDAVPRMVEELLSKANLTKEDIDLFIFHQANKFMLNAIRKKMDISQDKFFIYLENCGNTVSSTIPIALYEAVNSNKLKKGDKILLAGFGVGYSWAGSIIQF